MTATHEALFYMIILIERDKQTTYSKRRVFLEKIILAQMPKSILITHCKVHSLNSFFLIVLIIRVHCLVVDSIKYLPFGDYQELPQDYVSDTKDTRQFEMAGISSYTPICKFWGTYILPCSSQCWSAKWHRHTGVKTWAWKHVHRKIGVY